MQTVSWNAEYAPSFTSNRGSESNMVQWFSERYISREEHQKIIEYYRKLVAQLHCKAKDLQVQIDELEQDYGVEYSEPTMEVAPKATPQPDDGSNVIMIDFSRAH